MLPIATVQGVKDGISTGMIIDLSEYLKKVEGATKVELQELTDVVANKLDSEPQHKHHIEDVKQLQSALDGKYDKGEKYSYNVILSDSEKIPFLEAPKMLSMEIANKFDAEGYKFYVDESNGDLMITLNNILIGNYSKAVGQWSWQIDGDAGHTHDEYALAEHTHDEYALAEHSHEIELPEHSHNEYALTTHSHDEYALTSHTHSNFNNNVNITGKLTVSGDITLGSNQGLTLQNNGYSGRMYLASNGKSLYFVVGGEHKYLWKESSQTITHHTNVQGEIGTFCESTGIIYDGYESIDETDCICAVQQSSTLNSRIIGIITSDTEFASHGDVLMKVVPGTYKLGDILAPDISGYARVATDTELQYMMLHAIPRPKITSLNTGIDNTVACFIV